MARARSSGRNDACRMARLPGVSSAAPDALDHAGADEPGRPGGEAAAGRGEGEPHDADGEDAPASVAVPERTAQQQEGSEREGVAGDDPLQRTEAAVEAAVDGGEGDADDRRIEKGDPRAEDGGRHDPASAGGGQEERLGGRARHFKMLTARATTRIPTTREMADSAINMSFAQGLIADTSVGLNAVAVAKEKWK